MGIRHDSRKQKPSELTLKTVVPRMGQTSLKKHQQIALSLKIVVPRMGQTIHTVKI